MKASQGKIQCFAPECFLLLISRGAMVVLALFLLFPSLSRGEQGWPRDCRQALVVLTPTWDSPTGQLGSFVLRNGRWEAVNRVIPITVGHRGLGWGVGLHQVREEEPQKREGDRRAPAGIFRLEFGFGTAAFRERSFPFQPVSKQDRWVDDPASRFYNQWVVEGDPRFPRDWKSAEVMARKDGLYDFVIVVAHNRKPVIPGRGSAIFLHSHFGPGRSTIGCTAMEKQEVKRLLAWLDLGAAPVFVQIPRSELGNLALPEGLRESVRALMPGEG